MENEKVTKQLFKGALLLTFTGLLSKILSAGYRIPLQNITGDLGFYIYQQIYPFLGIALMLSLYGFPTAVSKLVAEHKDNGIGLSISSFYLPVFGILCVINGVLFMGIYMNAGLIASTMGDAKLEGPLRVAAMAFLFVPFTSIIRGVFQGLNDMKPTALSQIIEQVVRVAIILITAVLLVKQGKNIYQIGTGAAFGSIVGASIAGLLLLTIWYKRKPFESKPYSFHWIFYLRPIVLYGFLISVNHMLLLLLQFSDAFTLIPNLIEYGYSEDQAKIWKGIFDRGQPLIQLGTVLGSSIALAIVPTITRKRLEQSPDQFISHIQSALKFSFYISVAATVGLIGIFPHANVLLFENAEGSFSLRILSLAILFSSLIITTASILQGLGYVYHTALYVMIGLVIKWLINSWLIPIYGITGSAVATVVSVLIVLLLNIQQLKKVLPRTKLLSIHWGAFLIATSVLILFLFIMNQYIFYFIEVSSRFECLGFVLLVSSLGAVGYLVLLVKWNGFTDKELSAFPFGELFVELKHRRKW
ncbi:oligosaccharide flippase family protein [Aquibacillus halophilus]|uniref:Oligosaccharide flippase family protein n=1 Tax=Aquibacillus halophilus TaxID=930132 RepID=A0A6A8DPK1_9BACI|nr:polysaccharide biosynthesis protein [Aquibacillus halophilus]MRH44987.1 oligosaccharide flippase family protein [Aquibacillus halophilus]